MSSLYYIGETGENGQINFNISGAEYVLEDLVSAGLITGTGAIGTLQTTTDNGAHTTNIVQLENGALIGNDVVITGLLTVTGSPYSILSIPDNSNNGSIQVSGWGFFNADIQTATFLTAPTVYSDVIDFGNLEISELTIDINSNTLQLVDGNVDIENDLTVTGALNVTGSSIFANNITAPNLATQTVSNGVTTSSPSEDAVYDFVTSQIEASSGNLSGLLGLQEVTDVNNSTTNPIIINNELQVDGDTYITGTLVVGDGVGGNRVFINNATETNGISIGLNSLYQTEDIDRQNNIGIGNGNAFFLKTGNFNVFIGRDNYVNALSGSRNVIIGDRLALNSQYLDRSVILGRGTFRNVQTGENNIAIGSQVLNSEDISVYSGIYIGNDINGTHEAVKETVIAALSGSGSNTVSIGYEGGNTYINNDLHSNFSYFNEIYDLSYIGVNPNGLEITDGDITIADNLIVENDIDVLTNFGVTGISTFVGDITAPNHATQQVVDGVTTDSPSEDAVYDFVVSKSGDLQSQIDATGDNLLTQIESNDGDISTLTTNLFNTGANLQGQITANDSDISDLENNLFITGANLQSQIDSNDVDISNLNSETGNLGFRISINEIDIAELDSETGNLGSRISSNDSEIAALNSETGNLGLRLFNTGANLQGQITANDSDISILEGATGNLNTRLSSVESDYLTSSDIVDAVNNGATTAPTQNAVYDFVISQIESSSGNLSGLIDLQAVTDVGSTTTNLITSNPGTTIGLVNVSNAAFLAGTASAGIGIDSNEVVSKGNDIIVGTIDDDALRFYQNASEVGRFHTNGYFGINTLSPQTSLQVDGRGRFTNTNESAASSRTGVEIHYSESSDHGIINSYDRTNSAWKDLKINADDLILNDSSAGNVGVGKIPTVKLDVDGDIAADNFATATVTNGVTDSSPSEDAVYDFVISQLESSSGNLSGLIGLQEVTDVNSTTTNAVTISNNLNVSDLIYANGDIICDNQYNNNSYTGFSLSKTPQYIFRHESEFNPVSNAFTGVLHFRSTGLGDTTQYHGGSYLINMNKRGQYSASSYGNIGLTTETWFFSYEKRYNTQAYNYTTHRIAGASNERFVAPYIISTAPLEIEWRCENAENDQVNASVQTLAFPSRNYDHTGRPNCAEINLQTWEETGRGFTFSYTGNDNATLISQPEILGVGFSGRNVYTEETVGINTLSPDTDYNLYVNGTSYFNDNVTVNGNVTADNHATPTVTDGNDTSSPSEDAVYDFVIAKSGDLRFATAQTGKTLLTLIQSNDADIAVIQSDITALESETGNLGSRISSNDTDITSLNSETGNLGLRIFNTGASLHGLIVANDSDISLLESSTGNLETRLSVVESDYLTSSNIIDSIANSDTTNAPSRNAVYDFVIGASGGLQSNIDGAGGSQDLQDVTDQGATTTNAITVNGLTSNDIFETVGADANIDGDLTAANATFDGYVSSTKSGIFPSGISIGNTGTDAIYFQNSTISLNINSDGSLSFNGDEGSLLTIEDSLSGSIFSAGGSAGIPVIEAFENNTVKLGDYFSNDFVITGNKIGINSGDPTYLLDVNGSGNFGSVAINGDVIQPSYTYLGAKSANYTLTATEVEEKYINTVALEIEGNMYLNLPSLSNVPNGAIMNVLVEGAGGTYTLTFGTNFYADQNLTVEDGSVGSVMFVKYGNGNFIKTFGMASGTHV